MHLRQIYSPTLFVDNPDHTDSHDQLTMHSYRCVADGSRCESGCDYKPGLWDIQQPNPHKTVRYLQRHGDVGIVVDSCYYYTIFTIKSQVVKNPPKCASVRGQVAKTKGSYDPFANCWAPTARKCPSCLGRCLENIFSIALVELIKVFQLGRLEWKIICCQGYPCPHHN